MSHHPTRRIFLGRSSGAAATLLLPTGLSAAKRSPNDIPSIAAVGVGGKGWTDSNGAARAGNIVAICDVDEQPDGRRGGLAKAARQWPKARRYTDWRVMLEKEKDLDGVTVSTPDHMHAPITMTALRQGIATYTQKPLTRTVHESRQITAAAKMAGVATQMGNQNHNGETYRTLVKLVQSGTLGKIKAAHAWSNRPIWPQGIERPAVDPKAAQPSLDWDLWLGVAPERPFAPGVYHPFKWRGWYDFGAGALGDMGCHILDPIYWALGVDAPLSVRYEGPPPMKETFPKWEVIHYRFPGSELTGGEPIAVTWYDGDRKPDPAACDLPGDTKLPDNGCLFVGEKGVAVTKHGSRGFPELYPEKDFADFPMEKLKTRDHYDEWITAIKGQGKTSSSFGYAGPLSEMVLLGCVACRVPDTTLQWDSGALKFSNSPDATALLREEYRKGWEVEGL